MPFMLDVLKNIRVTILRQGQPTWAVSPPVGCYHLHPPSLFVRPIY